MTDRAADGDPGAKMQRSAGSSGMSCMYQHQYLCKCTSALCVNPASRDEYAQHKINAPFPGDTPVVDPTTGKPVRGVQFRGTIVAGWPLPRRRAFMKATGLDDDSMGKAKYFLCACHFRFDDLAPGHRHGSFVMAVDKLPRTPMQLAQASPPVALLPWTRALDDERHPPLVCVLGRADMAAAAAEPQRARDLAAARYVLLPGRATTPATPRAVLTAMPSPGRAAATSAAAAAKAVETVASQKEAAKAKLKTTAQDKRELERNKDANDKLVAQCESDSRELALFVRHLASTTLPPWPHSLLFLFIQRAMKTSGTWLDLRRALMHAYANKTLKLTVLVLRRVAAYTRNPAAQALMELLLAPDELVRRICGQLCLIV
jgi:hypothetical protein